MVTFSVGEKILNGTSYVLTEALVLIKPLSGVRTFLQGMGSDASWEMRRETAVGKKTTGQWLDRQRKTS